MLGVCMRWLMPSRPSYDPLAWRGLPFEARAKLVCAAWAEQGYGTPVAIFGVYALKIVVFVAGWVGWCSLSSSLGGVEDLSRWWLEPLAFQKAIVWSMLGCVTVLADSDKNVPIFAPPAPLTAPASAASAAASSRRRLVYVLLSMLMSPPHMPSAADT